MQGGSTGRRQVLEQAAPACTAQLWVTHIGLQLAWESQHCGRMSLNTVHLLPARLCGYSVLRSWTMMPTAACRRLVAPAVAARG